jgi:hypothetical protein
MDTGRFCSNALIILCLLAIPLLSGTMPQVTNAILLAESSPPSISKVELKLDHPLPPMSGGNEFVMVNTTATIQMELDDSQHEAAYGVNDDTNAYQFIWFNRFTPQSSDYPFVLKEIWVMFDDINIETNVNVGDAIELVVYADPDSDPTNGATWLSTYSAEIQAVDGITWTITTLSPPLLLSGPGDVLIGVINRQVISGLSGLSYPALIDTTAGHDRSWIGWWNFDPPDPAELPPDGDLALMTGDIAGNWLIRGYGGSPDMNIYVPVVWKNAGIPSTPILFDIDNSDGDGSYTINWSPASLVTSYTLQEDDNADFLTSSVIYLGPNTSAVISGKNLGNYYYRVRAENGMGSSNWSEVKMVSVTQQSELICETHEFGTVGVAWPIYPSGIAEVFSTENNMVIETLEVKSVLKALFPVYVHVFISINGEPLADKSHYVTLNAYTPYYINKDVVKELHAGDQIRYFITKAVGDTEAWIRWGNYVKLCGR